MSRAIDFYTQHAAQRFEQYESLRFESVHALILPLLPPHGSAILDIGSGSGRDAAALSAMGYRVTAVEPCGALRRLAHQAHGAAGIEWIDDRLPDIASLRTGRTFSLVLLSAVWMHVPPVQRSQAMNALSDVLATGGHLVMLLRLAEADSSRDMYPISAEEVVALAGDSGLRVALHGDVVDDLQQRAAVHWQTVVLVKSRAQ